MDGVVVEDLVVDLVRDHQQVVAPGEVEHCLQHLPRIDGASGVVRVDDHDGTGPAGDLRCHVGQVREPGGVFVAQVVHRLAARQGGDGGPQREVRGRDQDLVAVVQQCLNGHRGQFGNPVAEEDVINVYVGETEVLVMLHDCTPGRQEAARIAVAVGAGEVADDVLEDFLRGFEAERRRVPDVQPQHAVPGPLQRVRVLDHRSADLIGNPGKLAGLPELHLQCPPGSVSSRLRATALGS
jgi:hypothetical protein